MARAQQIWFTPPDNLPRANRVLGSDFPELFSRPERWAGVLAHIKVFGMNPRYPIAASDDELRRLFGFLDQHGIALSAGVAMVTAHDCGYNVEGMTLAGGPGAIARRIKKLGGNLQYVAMDEPLIFGRDYNGKNACHYSIEDIAKTVAENVREVRAIFPQVQIVEAEPIEHLGSDWNSEVERWLDAYRSALGEYPLAFLDDPFWDGPWRERIPPLKALLDERRIEFGVLFVAGVGSSSDRGWIDTAKSHVMQFRSAFPDLVLNQAVFTSWEPHPTHILPDTNPLSLTGLVLWYVQAPAGPH